MSPTYLGISYPTGNDEENTRESGRRSSFIVKFEEIEGGMEGMKTSLHLNIGF